VLVYIREAHPDSVLRTTKDGKDTFKKIEQTERAHPGRAASSRPRWSSG
jgi:hypothetical protein